MKIVSLLHAYCLFKKEILSFHLSVCTCFSFSSLPFLVHAPGAVQEIQEEHNGYPSEAEADQVASSTCSSVWIVYLEAMSY